MRALHLSAFKGPAEAGLVEALHAGGHAPISLVADDDGMIAGHILFSRMNVTVAGRAVRALALAPVAVTPDRQKQGIGSALIREGHARAEQDGWQALIVLGEPEYYGRFGYRADIVAHVISPYAGPYLMGLELAPGAMRGATGEMTYAPPFAAL